MGYADCHCHILPGLDDGPGNVDDALGLLHGLQDLGFSDIYPTPHQKAGAWAPSPAARAAARQALQQAAASAGLTVHIHPAGGENMWDELFLARLEDDTIPPYPGGKAFLVELRPEALPPGLPDHLFRFRMNDRLPVVAHVERFPALVRDRGRLEAVRRSAALLVNLSALGGMSGWGTKRLARRLVRDGAVHAVATDSHGADDVSYSRAGMSWIRSALGEATLHALLADHPRRIVNGELPDW